MRSWDSLDAHLRMMSRKKMANGIYYSMERGFSFRSFLAKKERSIMAGIPSIGKDNYYGYYGMGNKNEHGGY